MAQLLKKMNYNAMPLNYSIFVIQKEQLKCQPAGGETFRFGTVGANGCSSCGVNDISKLEDFVSNPEENRNNVKSKGDFLSDVVEAYALSEILFPSGGGAKKLPSSKTNEATKNRVKLRKGVVDQIKKNAPKTKDGKYIDPNTKKPITKEYDIGHKTGQEWRTRKEMHKKKGSTRKQVIEEENNPDLYQIEDRSNNRSHKFEKKNN